MPKKSAKPAPKSSKMPPGMKPGAKAPPFPFKKK